MMQIDVIQRGMCAVAKLCPPLCYPMDCSLSGSSVHGIFQARILEWVALSFSRGSSRPRDWICVSCTRKQILYHCATWEAIRGGRGQLKNRKFHIRRDGGPRRQVNPRAKRLKIVRLCLYNQEKPTEPINHSDLNLGDVYILKNSFVNMPVLLSPYSCRVIWVSVHIYLSPPAVVPSPDFAVPCSPQMTSRAVSGDTLNVLPNKRLGLMQHFCCIIFYA